MLSEEMRLLYVAMTRAKEKLILVDCLKNARSHVQKLSALTELPVPPQVVRSAKTMGDWVLQVLLCSTEAGAIHAWAGIAPPVRESAAGWRVYLHENPATPAAARGILNLAILYETGLLSPAVAGRIYPFGGCPYPH